MDGLDGNGTCVCAEAFQGSHCQFCSDPGKYGPQCDKGKYSRTSSAQEHGLFLLDLSNTNIGVNCLLNSLYRGWARSLWGTSISYFKRIHHKARVSESLLTDLIWLSAGATACFILTYNSFNFCLPHISNCKRKSLLFHSRLVLHNRTDFAWNDKHM